MDSSAFFNGWSGPLRTLVIAICAYAVLLVWLRLSGKRTMSKWNAFDLIVTVALGSTLATIVLSKTTTLVDGAVALGTLVGLQFVLTWLSVRLGWLRRAIKSRPTLLLRHGQVLHDALRRQRVTVSELQAAVRNEGLASLGEVAFVVLETDGTFSVIREAAGDRSALEGVEGVEGADGPSPVRGNARAS